MKTNVMSWLTWLWLLALAIVTTIYLAWLTYPLAISTFDLTRYVELGAGEIQHNFNQLMTYLVNPFVKHLAMDDLPLSTSGLKHFADVKHLFLLAEGVVLVLAIPAVRFLKTPLKKGYLGLYRKTLFVLAALPIVIALVAALIGFDQFFVLFHTVLFPGDSTWLFDPYTDPVINILPEYFFLACFLAFLLIYEGVFIGLSYLSYKQTKRVK